MLSTLFAIILLAQQEVPGAKPLDALDGDARSKAMVAGIDKFLDRKTAEISADRRKRWEGMVSKPGFPDQKEMRAKLRTALGIESQRAQHVDLRRMTVRRRIPFMELKKFTAEEVAWTAADGRRAEALLLMPTGRRASPFVVAIPDSCHSPEMICGLQAGLRPESQYARLLVEAGATVLVPAILRVDCEHSGNAGINRRTKQPHREWIYRQAYELGRHPLGMEVETALACAGWYRIAHVNTQRLVVGHGDGAMTALYAAALDVNISGAYVGGCFQGRSHLYEQPIWRNVFGLLRDFDDPEAAALILPRALGADRVALNRPNHGAWASSPGLTPGRIVTTPEVSFNEAVMQSKKYAAGFHTQPAASFLTVAPPASSRDDDLPLCAGLEEFSARFGLIIDRRSVAPSPYTIPDEHQERLVREFTDAVQREYRASERVRRELWKDVDPKKIRADRWHDACASLREKFRKEVIGEFEDKKSPPNPRARKLSETPKWVLHDVVLDVWPEVFAWGYLLLPKDLKPGEKRPVVVCQHGLEGLPEDTVTDDPKHPGFGPYQAFSAKLADRGFIVFAPHNPYRGRDSFRVLQRKANPLGRSLFSVIVAQHEVITDWLAGLPFVDPTRIGFYGLSYGGKTAMRVPALVDRYCLSICSADFNDWIRKNVVVDDHHSYMFTGEYEMPEFNLGRTFNYAEMAALIAPRPFMVERGHYDGVAPDEWVAYEYAKVRRLYAELGIADRTEIEFFLGPHQIHGVGTYRFLHRHLRWPER